MKLSCLERKARHCAASRQVDARRAAADLGSCMETARSWLMFLNTMSNTADAESSNAVLARDSIALGKRGLLLSAFHAWVGNLRGAFFARGPEQHPEL